LELYSFDRSLLPALTRCQWPGGAARDFIGLGRIAAPVSLERLHLCCKGSCEFVESSHALSRVAESSPRLDFLLEKKYKPSHLPAAEIFCQEKIFPESGIHICVDYMQIRAG
jgi:hypothetical protein